MAEIWRDGFIGLVKRMGDDEQTHYSTDVDQESVFRYFHQIEPKDEKNRISEWERTVGIVY